MDNNENIIDGVIKEFDAVTVRDLLQEKIKREETLKNKKKTVRLKDWLKKENNNSDITTFDL